MRTVSPSPLLKMALVADALVSGTAAALQVGASRWLSELLRLPHALLVETGLFLLAYAILLVVLARSNRVLSVAVGVVVLGNILWAACCVVLLLARSSSLNLPGVVYMIVQALAVLTFAGLEYTGLKASKIVAGTRAMVVQ